MKEKQMQKYELMTFKETASYLGIAEKTLYTKANQRQIPYLKLGRLLKFDRNAINELFIMIQPAHLQKIEGKKLSASERDNRRASLIREKIGG